MGTRMSPPHTHSFTTKECFFYVQTGIIEELAANEEYMDTIIILTILGVLSSVAAEIVTALNKKLTGTVLQGDGAFIVAFSLAVLAAVGKVAILPLIPQHIVTDLLGTAAAIFSVSQIYFKLIVSKLGLDIQTDTTVVPVTKISVPAENVLDLKQPVVEETPADEVLG